jgi:hypothetical protein
MKMKQSPVIFFFIFNFSLLILAASRLNPFLFLLLASKLPSSLLFALQSILWAERSTIMLLSDQGAKARVVSQITKAAWLRSIWAMLGIFVLFFLVRYVFNMTSLFAPGSSADLPLSLIDAFFIVVSTGLSISFAYVLVFWFISRFVQIKEWNEKAQRFVLNFKKIFPWGLLFLSTLPFFLFLNDFEYTLWLFAVDPKSSPRSIFRGLAPHFLLAEIIVLAVAQFIMYVDGHRSLRARSDFCSPDFLEKIPINSEHQIP